MKAKNGLLMIVAAAILAACGSSSTRDFTTSGLNTGTNGSGGGTTGGTNGGGNGGIPPGLNPAPVYQAIFTGVGGLQPVYALPQSFTTSALLRIKVAPLPAPNSLVPGYSNYVFAYGCLKLTVTVNGIEKSTQFLRVSNMAQSESSPCKNAPDSEILDFTYQVGAGNFTVQVSKPDYDNCRTRNTFEYGCGQKAMISQHTAAASISVQFDGTYMP